ncbi:MAG: polysaccharide deacetylase family protein [Oscillospiraceae bacterium]
MRKYAVITMDVEDWYHTYFPECDVDRTISLLDGLDVVLKIMEERNIKGSFFVVGEIAEKLKEKIQKMDQDGHDIACHNYYHLRPTTMELNEYRKQLLQAKDKIESILGHNVSGYRAPSFGIDDERLSILKECGFSYDSSMIKPQKSTKYGALNLQGFQEVYSCIYKKDGFTEFEVSTQKIGNMNMLLGGGYIRMLPWCFMRWMTQRYLDTGKLYVMYIHPIDLSSKPMPKVTGISIDRYFRTHVGRKHMVKRFCKIIEMLEKNKYEFVTFEQMQNMKL